MKEIIILSRCPMIITKDKAWFDNFNEENSRRRKQYLPMTEGRVIVLPEDAILVSPPEVTEVKVDLEKQD